MLLTKAEVSLEGRYRRVTTPFLDRGRLSGALTDRSDDTVAGASYRRTSGTFSPSFVSFVYPAGRWAIAGYRHELVKLRDGFQTRGVFQDITISGLGTVTLRENPLTANREIDIVNYGFAAAYRINKQFAFGGGVSLYHLQLESDFQRFATVGPGGDVFGPPDYSRELFRVTQDGDDTAVAGPVDSTTRRTQRFGLASSIEWDRVSMSSWKKRFPTRSGKARSACQTPSAPASWSDRSTI